MKKIGTVNGVAVYSDKAVASIMDTRVSFSDGSWCDVATGQVVNNGPGGISIGTPGENTAKTTLGPNRFNASAVDVNQITADLTVEVHDRPELEVTIVGPESAVKAIKTYTRGDTLMIEGEASPSSGGMTIISRGGGSVVSIGGGGSIRNVVMGSIRAGNIVVGGGSEESDTKVTVKVPKGTSLRIASLDGNAQVGNIEAPLTVSANMGGSMNIGKVTDANLTIQGSTDLSIAEVNGNLSAQIMGSGNVYVPRGNVGTLNVNIMGSGDLSFGGAATYANLTVMGSGDIRVARVHTQPNKTQMGSGRIRVSQVG